MITNAIQRIRNGYSTKETLRDYNTRTDAGHISLGFQPANPVTFDIKNYVLPSLRVNPFGGQAIRDPWEHLARFYETCLICKPNEVINYQIK